MTYQFSDFCVCPRCYGDLVEGENTLRCTVCKEVYEIRNGIPILLVPYESDEEKRYFDCYHQIAEADLKTALEPNRDYRYQELLKFINVRRLRGKRLLDIGPGAAGYLQDLNAELVVALDIAYPYLEKIAGLTDVVCICGDAERLPFKTGFFDCIMVASVLEHLLHPDAFLARLYYTCRPDTTIIVEVPWEENLGAYKNSEYEFTHLRSFNNYTFSTLWYNFYCKRYRTSYPNLTYPLIFSLQGKIPLFIYNALIKNYYFGKGVLVREYEWRMKKALELPKSAWWLKWFTRPVFKMFEMYIGENWFYSATKEIGRFVNRLRGK